MKITIYELLGMIKDGKIPEKIIFNGYEYLYHDKEHGYCRSAYDCTYICIDSEYYLFDILNDEVEILEEQKKILKKLELPSFNEFKTMTSAERYVVTAKEYDVLNDIIDYLESKGDE